MSQYCFISIMGTQVMGTIDPLLSLLSSGVKVATVHLLVSEKVLDVSSRFGAFCQEHNIEIIVDFISLPDTDNSSSEPLAQDKALQIAQAASEQGMRCIFNLNGGTNLQISHCALALSPFKTLWIQALKDRIILDDNGSLRYLNAPIQLRTEEIINLQGISLDFPEITHEDNTVKNFCTKEKLSPPQHAIANVRVSDVFFDLIWANSNNRLNFLTVCFDFQETNKERLQSGRNISHWAASRYRSKHLFDRSVFVLTSNLNTKEHLSSESNGKIVAIDCFGGWNNVKELRKKLQDIFTPQNICTPQKVTLPKRIAIEVPENTLILSMGTNPATTLVCIKSHAPQHVFLCHTKDLQNKATLVRDMASSLGLKSIRLVSCSHDGSILPACFAVPTVPENVHVNITPGTKGQGAYLALWGQKHGVNVWAVQPQSESIERLSPSPASITLIGADPTYVLRAQGERVKAQNITDSEDHERNVALLHFLRAALNDKRVSRVFNKTLGIKNAGKLLLLGDKKCELHSPDGIVYPFSFSGGQWLESLAAQAFADAGAHDIYYNVEILGSEERAERTEKKYAQSTFLMEIDVLGAFGGSHFLVSCKSHPKSSQIDAIREARAMARALERFTLIFVCHLGCYEAKFDEENRTQVIGWRELCQPEVLQELLRKLRAYRPQIHIND